MQSLYKLKYLYILFNRLIRKFFKTDNIKIIALIKIYIILKIMFLRMLSKILLKYYKVYLLAYLFNQKKYLILNKK